MENQNYINTVTKTMLKLKRFSMLFNVHRLDRLYSVHYIDD